MLINLYTHRDIVGTVYTVHVHTMITLVGKSDILKNISPLNPRRTHYWTLGPADILNKFSIFSIFSISVFSIYSPWRHTKVRWKSGEKGVAAKLISNFQSAGVALS